MAFIACLKDAFHGWLTEGPTTRIVGPSFFCAYTNTIIPLSYISYFPTFMA